MLNVLVPKVCLQRPGIVTTVRQRITTVFRQELCRIPSILKLVLVCQTLLRASKDIVAHADR
jgi:hypothetical protein